MGLSKTELRKQLIARRKALDPVSKAEMDKALFENIISCPHFKSAKLVLAFVSTEIEVDTRRLIQYCFDTGKPVAVPISGDTELTFCIITDFSQLHKGRYGIYEPLPEKAVTDFSYSICLVPALQFDKNNYRIGYGKGYYDRFLSRYNGFSAGLCYKSFIGEVPVDKFDHRVDIVITD
ncbi:MAG: 5-formyltetrahydrofolate cyclo-ligase [Ruminiclostridium sp.]